VLLIKQLIAVLLAAHRCVQGGGGGLAKEKKHQRKYELFEANSKGWHV
jgi:hypothetical protein